MLTIEKIGLGGGCHWCTEGIFQSLIGIQKVEQGWIASNGINNSLSEAVIVSYYPDRIDLKTLIEIHLLTHSSTYEHAMRAKYRSAIYTFTNNQNNEARQILHDFQRKNPRKIITKILPFRSFKMNQESYLSYFYTRPGSPFCKTYIHLY